MAHFNDQAVVLSLRAHGEAGAVAALLTENHGRHAGYVHGGQSTRLRGQFQPGTVVAVSWRAQAQDQLGTYTLEPVTSYGTRYLDDPLRLSAVLSACALCETSLPEREGHAGLYLGLVALLESLETEMWGAAYVMWEIALLRELGFALGLSRCAQGGDARTLTHVSPRTGRAVSAAMAEPYLDRLLPLPLFLKPGGTDDPACGSLDDVAAGLALTGRFLSGWVFAHHRSGVPDARRILESRVQAALVQGSSPALNRGEQDSDSYGT